MSELIKLDQVGKILKNIGNKIATSTILMRCLQYNSPDALSTSLPDVSMDEIINICGLGDTPKTQQKLFKVPFYDRIIDNPRSEIRFFAPMFSPENIYLSEVIVSFQIIINNTLWDLEDDQRPVVMINEILNLFNSYDIGSIGELQLDDSIKMVMYNSEHTGYQINFKTRTC